MGVAVVVLVECLIFHSFQAEVVSEDLVLVFQVLDLDQVEDSTLFQHLVQFLEIILMFTVIMILLEVWVEWAAWAVWVAWVEWAEWVEIRLAAQISVTHKVSTTVANRHQDLNQSLE